MTQNKKTSPARKLEMEADQTIRSSSTEPGFREHALAHSGLVPVYLVFGRANTGKTEIVRAFIELCDEAGVPITIVDLDAEKKDSGSLFALYGTTRKDVIRLEKAINGADIAEFLWPQIAKFGKDGKPVFIDCAGSDPRLSNFTSLFNVKHLAEHYNVEIIPTFVVSADKADWQYLKRIEAIHELGRRKIFVYNEKFATRAKSAEAGWKAFAGDEDVVKFEKEGAAFVSIPNEEEIQKVSHLPVHRGQVGQTNAVSLALESTVPVWRQTRILEWYRQVGVEFSRESLGDEWKMPWHE